MRQLINFIVSIFCKKPTPPRDIQTIFNTVIDNGIYDSTFSNSTSPLMCLALNSAESLKVITKEEHKIAYEAIQEYLEETPYPVLSEYLKQKNLPCDFEARKQIYLDWSTRP